MPFSSNNICALVFASGLSLIAYTPALLAQEAKRPVPSDAELQQAMTLAREVYGEEYKAAKTSDQKRALAEKLIQKAAESKADLPSHFTLLKLARDVAATGGEADLALKAVEQLIAIFEVNPVAVKHEALTKAAQAARTQKQKEIVAQAAVALMDEAVSADSYDIAQEVGKRGLVAARAARQKEVVAQLLMKTKEVEEIASEYDKAREAMAAIKDRPVDPALNLVVGKYLCFVKADWGRGLPMLALGSDETLSALSKQELQGANSADEQAKLGDGWWNLAQKEMGGAKSRLEGRAAYWYRQALPGLTGLAKDRIQNRVGSITQPAEHGEGTVRESIEAGLNWLAKQQARDGSWTFATKSNPGTNGSVVAATSLAVTPFIRAGSTHFSGKHKAIVSKAVNFLLSRMKNQGDLRDWDNMYVQGIATIALCEAYAVSKDKKLRGPCQSAVNFIVSVQHPVKGGWRYKPGNEGDTSVVAWQVTALKIAQDAGLAVPPQTFLGAHRWLDSVQEDNGALYRYTPPEKVSPSMTAAGLFCRSSLGWTGDTPALKRGVARVTANEPLDDIYFCYYATRLMHRYGGEEWQAWRKATQTRLVGSQSKDGATTGSWFSEKEKWFEPLGRLGLTSFYLMTLGVGQE